MAVTVKDTTSSEGTTFAAGTNFIVKDGHLIVLGTEGLDFVNVAVYAPGQWYSAEVKKA
jgi:hypothetical protein